MSTIARLLARCYARRGLWQLAAVWRHQASVWEARERAEADRLPLGER